MPIIKFKTLNLNQIANTINNGGICVLPTDTLYGLSCSIYNKGAVERIYTLKQRENEKPFIILISDIGDIEKLGINISAREKEILERNWPASLSVVFNVTDPDLAYLHRNQKSLAFRIPNYPLLLKLLKVTGPITSTTVNISGQNPCASIKEAYNLFGEKVDLYADTGKSLSSKPSTVIRFTNEQIEILRQGSYKLI